MNFKSPKQGIKGIVGSDPFFLCSPTSHHPQSYSLTLHFSLLILCTDISLCHFRVVLQRSLYGSACFSGHQCHSCFCLVCPWLLDCKFFWEQGVWQLFIPCSNIMLFTQNRKLIHTFIWIQSLFKTTYFNIWFMVQLNLFCVLFSIPRDK